jgi:hypothetical protein
MYYIGIDLWGANAGIIINSSNLGFQMTPVRGEIQQYIDLPVF